MKQPKIGERVSIWTEGIVKSLSSDYKGEIKVEILNNDTGAHCFVPLSALEPREK